MLNNDWLKRLRKIYSAVQDDNNRQLVEIDARV